MDFPLGQAGPPAGLAPPGEPGLAAEQDSPESAAQKMARELGTSSSRMPVLNVENDPAQSEAEEEEQSQ